MSAGGVILLVVVGGIAALFIAAAISDAKLRKMRATPVAQCRDGDLVKVVGTVVPIESMKAPFSGRECVAYHLESRITQGKNATKVMLRPFYIQDASGVALVDPSALQKMGTFMLRLDVDRKDSRILKMMKPTDTPALRELGVTAAESIHEGIVEPGETVAVYAMAMHDAVPRTAGESGFRDGALTKVRLVPPKKQNTFLITDMRNLIGS
jgi:hypothetical protein